MYYGELENSQLKKCKFIAAEGAQTQQPTGSQINCMDLYENLS